MTSRTNIRSLLLSLCITLVIAHNGGFAVPTASLAPRSQPSPTPNKAAKHNSNANTKGPSPTPTPPAVSNMQERQELKRSVETAVKEVTEPSSYENMDRKKIVQLESEVNVFNKRVEVPESNIEDLKAEANKIIAEANRMRDESRPSFWSALIGSSLTEHLGRAAVFSLLLLTACVFVLVLRLQCQIKDAHSSLNRLGQGIGHLKESAGRLEAGLSRRSTERHQMTNDQALDNLCSDFHSFKDEIIQFLEQLRNTPPFSEKVPQSEISISEQVRPDLRTLAKAVYVGDFLQNITKDRQVSVRYEIANEHFVADPLGKLVVVTDGFTTNKAILLPKASRLNSPDQFDTYYTQAYDCERLSLGSLFVLTPAVVEKENDGWKLATRGTLELRG